MNNHQANLTLCIIAGLCWIIVFIAFRYGYATGAKRQALKQASDEIDINSLV